jgi:histidinol phosphatase-like PHP family hydrolase
MRYVVDHDFHIHTYLSSCSRDPEQNVQTIIDYAKSSGIKTVCITDHYWDSAVLGSSNWYAPQNFEHISKSKPLPQDENIKFLFGAETELKRDLTLGIPLSRFNDFDFVIIPTTHFHMSGFTVNEDEYRNNEKLAKLWIKRLDYLLDLPLPFEKIGIAHLACGLINNNSREDYLNALSLLSDSEMERVFSRLAKAGCGIELNKGDMSFSDSEADIVLRPFKIAKNCGCKFYMGSDAHTPKAFIGFKEVFERAITLLDLKESDKFYIK